MTTVGISYSALNDCDLSATRPQRQIDEAPFECHVNFTEASTEGILTNVT